MSTSPIVLDPLEVETRRREREHRLAAFELPLVRLGGSALLSVALLLHNIYLVPQPLSRWVSATIALALYAAASWALIVVFLRRTPPRDLTVPALAGDLLIWTYAIYCSGAEASWLFFILLLRVADQTQTTFRRACAFAVAATACYAGMLTWVAAAGGREVMNAGQMTKLVLILCGGIYISLAARTAEHRRARLTEAIRVSRDLIRKLEQAHARAEEASAAKSEFVANISHEMRTPLQAVIGMLQLAIEDEPSQSKSRRLLTARRSAETLLSMIDDVLDFSRIEARKLELEPVYFSLRQLIHDTMKSVGIMAASKKLILSYSVQPDVPETVWADPVRLRQIVVNLVGNAIKFTHAGEISVTVSRAGDKARIDVRDTGVGIAPAVRQRIFEPFAQADSSHSRPHGGAGLGLSIVARLLDAMGGSVQVSSEQGTGSVFSFSVPLATDAVGVAPERKGWESQLVGKAILVLEHEEMARGVIAQILRSRGVFATSFSRASDVPPQARFACAVTADSAVGVRPQVVIASPLDTTNYAHRVTRPVGERELIDAIGVALGLAEPPAEYTLEPNVAEARHIRVLLVDDSEVNLEVVSEMLRRLGHEVTLAADGETALARLADETFDVVFMDVQLPGMDGLETTRRYRDSGGRTPVVALTAHTSMRDRDRCLAAGMNAVLTKPADSTHLAAAIEKVTHRDAIAEVVGGNMALLARVRDAFRKQTPELLAGIRDAIGRRDGEALAAHAHKLKGSMSYFPADRGAGIALEIEQAAHAADFILAAGLLPDLERAIGELERALS
ncbi:MAG TPA: ATP-binding protein [Thermoanaerobaculia bacterium]|nr:ATP-binding protein [Thermoanaerobaculia bacterium]